MRRFKHHFIVVGFVGAHVYHLAEALRASMLVYYLPTLGSTSARKRPTTIRSGDDVSTQQHSNTGTPLKV